IRAARPITQFTHQSSLRPYMLPLACKSFFNKANLKVQYSKFNVQSQPIPKFNIQTSTFKVS
ncbi:hypothetical protein, partial [Segatella maculosa]|uniref:hypothetical protein n=1 Tax=Segatella maculosa TaxID=439703 RepID=UPI0028D4DEF9